PPIPNATSTTFLAACDARMSVTLWQTASGSAPRIPQSFWAMLPSLASRAELSEIMDDLSRPEEEFAGAYRELEIINRRLGGVRAIERYLPAAPPDCRLLILDVAAGACDVSEALLESREDRIVVLDLNGKGLRLARKSWPVVGDALELPFREATFDVVMA